MQGKAWLSLRCNMDFNMYSIVRQTPIVKEGMLLADIFDEHARNTFNVWEATVKPRQCAVDGARELRFRMLRLLMYRGNSCAMPPGKRRRAPQGAREPILADLSSAMPAPRAQGAPSSRVCLLVRWRARPARARGALREPLHPYTKGRPPRARKGRSAGSPTT